jgi:hypothetical protein
LGRQILEIDAATAQDGIAEAEGESWFDLVGIASEGAGHQPCVPQDALDFGK